jgi:transcriptional regulator with XRE-family HTH domain
MEIRRKDRLARVGDSSRDAAATRLRGAIAAIGMTQSEFARRSGQNVSAVNNSVTALAFPSRKSLQELYRVHRIDPTFILFGDYGQLPLDVQDRLFVALENEAREGEA